ncbi:hypothetical protein GCM10009872_59280 [Actinopolymorpha rutila]
MRIADVAGGHGELAYWLQELGHVPVVIEPRDVRLPRWIQRDLRKRSVRERRLTTIDRIARPVQEVDLSPFDLVVALHPDEATEPAVRAAVRHNLDFAVVPCCVFAEDGAKYTSQAWLDYLASIAPRVSTSHLSISGANTVLWRRRCSPSQASAAN